MIKTYKCPIHGEFDIEMDIGDEELKSCPKEKGNCLFILKGHENDIVVDPCNQPVTRVFKPTHYSWKCQGFAGKGFST